MSDTTTTIVIVGAVVVVGIAAIVMLKPKKEPSKLEQVLGGIGDIASGLGIARTAPPPTSAAAATNGGKSRLAIQSDTK